MNIINNLVTMYRKYKRYMGTRYCYRGHHPWYPAEDGPLPKDCPACVADIIKEYGPKNKD